MVTLSVPTSPEALEPSPYEMFQVDPEVFLKVLDLLGLKMVWLDWLDDCVDDGSSVDHTQRSADLG